MGTMPAPEQSDAVVLLSGGLDSAVALGMARARGLRCLALAVEYGQRHAAELDASRAVADALGAPWVTVHVSLDAVGGSALTDPAIDVPKDRADPARARAVPVTYVPARNLIFLSIAAGVAEVRGASAIFIGVNAVDYSGYPDCRAEFITAFEHAARLGTRAGTEGAAPVRVETPLMEWTKARIVQEGARLGVPLHLTLSCYDPVRDARAMWVHCGRCDSCQIRRRGFADAGVSDPTRYART